MCFQICPFLHYAFLNVSWYGLHEKMHNHIGCICLAFLHCVFWSVSSKSLPQRRQSHIGCICLIFLRCVFSKVSSNGPYERMHSYIDCICLTLWFLHFAPFEPTILFPRVCSIATFRYDICHKHHKQRLYKIISTLVRFFLVNVFLEHVCVYHFW